MLALQEDLSGARADLHVSGSRVAALHADTRQQSEQIQRLLMRLEQAERAGQAAADDVVVLTQRLEQADRAGQAAADDVVVLTQQLKACQGKLSSREKQSEEARSAAGVMEQQRDLMSR